MVGALRVRLVPWELLHGVRRDGDELLVAWRPYEVVDVGPFQPAPEHRDREDAAEQLGAAMLLLRQRALAAAAPARDVTSRPSPLWAVLGLYAAVVAATLWFTLR